MFASLEANNVARKPRKIVGVKALGEQVAEFMRSEGLNAPEMARRVGTTRQNIENLAAGKVSAPRYLKALAKVMQTSSDVLLAGQYRHPSARQGIFRPAEALSDKEGGPSPRESTAMPQQSGQGWPFQNYISRHEWESLEPHERALIEWAAFEEMKKVLAARPQASSGKRRSV